MAAPVVLLVLIGMTVLMAFAVVHIIDTGTVVPSVSASRAPAPAPAPAPAARPVVS